MEVIGTRGKNWPVYGGKDQIRMITASANTANEVNPAPTLSPHGRSRNNERSASPSKKYIRDPHASLNLYEEQQEERIPSAPNAVAPRESARPAPRDMSDLFAAGHEDYETKGPDGSPKKSAKEVVIAPKGAAHKRFQPSRVFEEEVRAKPERQIYKTNPARYNHFDIGDADDNDTFQHRDENAKRQDVPIRPKAGPQQRNTPQWGFEDFAAPEKTNQKARGQDVVHFSYGDTEKDQSQPSKQAGKPRREEETHFDFHDNGTPIPRNAIAKSRKDQASHFEFNDEPSPAPRRIIARTAAAQKLYADPVFGQDEDERPLHTISHNARKDLASQWDVPDETSANGRPHGKGQMRKGLESHWGVDGEEAAPKQQTAARGRKEVEKGFWEF